MNDITDFKVGDKVEKIGGDYTFIGYVLCVYYKRDGKSIRVDVEMDNNGGSGDGMIHIFSPKQLRHVTE